MTLRSVKELDVKGKTVLLRAGFDVSLQSGGEEEGTFRIRSAIATLDYLVKERAKIVVLSHLGRPKGRDLSLNLKPAAQKLAQIWKRKLAVIASGSQKLPEYAVPHLYFFPHNLEAQDLKPLIAQMREGDAALLENLRFYSGEEANDPEFAKKLARLGEAYVNDAFSVCHRAHASIAALAELLPAGAGLALLKEVAGLGAVLSHPKRPLVVMMGGVKLSDKAAALQNLAKSADYILLGGGLANLFLKVRGFEIGKSVWEEGNQEKFVQQLWRDHREKILLPQDVVVSRSRDGEPECVKVTDVQPGQFILDVGPETIREYSKYLKKGRTLVWGGPMGYFENPSFSHGTFALAWLLASRGKSPRAFTVAGGGQTLEVIEKLGLGDQIDLVSTGGGAMLDFLAGESLPGLEVLKK